MVIREYICTVCKHEFSKDEDLYKPSEQKCPKCEGKLKQKYSCRFNMNNIKTNSRFA